MVARELERLRPQASNNKESGFRSGKMGHGEHNEASEHPPRQRKTECGLENELQNYGTG
jgi:hypothetical protein